MYPYIQTTNNKKYIGVSVTILWPSVKHKKSMTVKKGACMVRRLTLQEVKFLCIGGRGLGRHSDLTS